MPRWVRAVQALTVLVLVAAGFAGWHLYKLRHADADMESARFLKAGERGLTNELMPRLDAVRIVVPERPHDPREFIDPAQRQKITRRRAFHLSTDSHGFRSRTEVSAKKSGFRIVLVGDSVSLGWGSEDDDSLPTRLAEYTGAEVVAAGRPGLQPGQIAGRCQEVASQIEADLYVIARRYDGGSRDPWQPFRDCLRAVAPARGAIVAHPLSTFDVRAIGDDRGLPSGAPAPALDLTPVFRAALPLPGEVLELEGRTQRVVELPARKVLLDLADATPGALDRRVVDLFERDDSIYEPLFYDGGHPDAEGNKIYARAVADFLRENGLLP
ncbi:MAG: hypothetical protein FJ102_19705 [Deltaproteobacteria bacterium]|nr:hypothetical protein [Deltaproteobacteria bacterium]